MFDEQPQPLEAQRAVVDGLAVDLSVGFREISKLDLAAAVVDDGQDLALHGAQGRRRRRGADRRLDDLDSMLSISSLHDAQALRRGHGPQELEGTAEVGNGLLGHGAARR